MGGLDHSQVVVKRSSSSALSGAPHVSVTWEQAFHFLLRDLQLSGEDSAVVSFALMTDVTAAGIFQKGSARQVGEKATYSVSTLLEQPKCTQFLMLPIADSGALMSVKLQLRFLD